MTPPAPPGRGSQDLLSHSRGGDLPGGSWTALPLDSRRVFHVQAKSHNALCSAFPNVFIIFCPHKPRIFKILSTQQISFPFPQTTTQSAPSSFWWKAISPPEGLLKMETSPPAPSPVSLPPPRSTSPSIILLTPSSRNNFWVLSVTYICIPLLGSWFHRRGVWTHCLRCPRAGDLVYAQEESYSGLSDWYLVLGFPFGFVFRIGYYHDHDRLLSIPCPCSTAGKTELSVSKNPAAQPGKMGLGAKPDSRPLEPTPRHLPVGGLTPARPTKGKGDNFPLGILKN